MQRKNSILRAQRRSHRKGMAMIMALTIIVITATILALSLSMTSLTSKRTSDLYLYEQAVLLSQSAAEYAMLQLSQNAPCSVDNLNFTYNTIYTVNIDMQYITLGSGACYNGANADGTDYAVVITPESDGTVIMDITITTNAGTEPIRYFRRSIQKL